MARSGAPFQGAPDPVQIKSSIVDRVAVLSSANNLVHPRRQDAWRKENVPVDRKLEQKEQRRIERAAERQIRAREGGKDPDLEGMVPGDRSPVRLSRS